MKDTYSLEDKYSINNGFAFMSGTQAIIKLAMLQIEIDKNNKKNTGGFISGYRGSPLGGLDQALWAHQNLLKSNDIVFQPGVNEELAATACWGTQQLHLHPETSTKDGVFSFWYAKGPGVDRSCDVLKHANMAGTSPFGGVVAIAGDDHIAKSSSVAHQSDHIFKACGIPVFFPSSVQEILDFGIHAIALSRFSGLWTSLKTIQEVVESTCTVEINPERIKPKIPEFKMPTDGLHIRWPDTPLAQEARIMDYKWYAALAYIKENDLNKHIYKHENDHFGIVATGKAYNDTLQALEDLGLNEEKCNQLGIRLFKVGVVWPLEPHGIRDFAIGLDEILVVEEKRQLIEYQIKEQLYGWRADVRPNILGKFNEMDGDYSGGEWSVSNPSENWLLSAKADLCSLDIAKAIYMRLQKKGLHESLISPFTETQCKQLINNDFIGIRNPWFCSGCPHNTSTKVPDGSRALAGIGCHYMVQWMDRKTETFSQMGGEGVSWVGQAPFSKDKHVFVNLGDGTYYHSGLLAIRQSISSKVNITYKILFNGAVAMTGGQPVEGGLSVENIATELYSEGVSKVIIVAEDTDKYSNSPFAIYHKNDIMKAQEELKNISGCTILIYDQMCATEKRRQIKKGKMQASFKRTVINSNICDGCGDCSTQSNCISVEPLYTTLGIKRKINQNSCNEDMSCIKGFCPSFLILENAKLKKTEVKNKYDFSKYNLITPDFKDKQAKIVIAGIGGTGVITTGQILGTAAHIDGKQSIVQEAAGLAQKGGATWCHVQISENKPILTTKVPKGKSSLLLISDLVVGSQSATLDFASKENTEGVFNNSNISTASFIVNKTFPDDNNEKIINMITDKFKQTYNLNFSLLSKETLGDSLYCNMMQLGYAFQKGLIPISEQAIAKAIELNGVQISNNLSAFNIGRIFALYPNLINTVSSTEKKIVIQKNIKSSDLLQEIKLKLTAYQNEELFNEFENIFNSYKDSLNNQMQVELLQNLFKVFYIKDEYEVSRLLIDKEFLSSLSSQFEDGYTSYFYIAPPLFTQNKIKINTKYAKPILKMVSNLSFLRNSIFDIFSYHQDRKLEYKIKNDYISILKTINPQTDKETIYKIIRWPQNFKGFGHVKLSKLSQAYESIKELL